MPHQYVEETYIFDDKPPYRVFAKGRWDHKLRVYKTRIFAQIEDALTFVEDLKLPNKLIDMNEWPLAEVPLDSLGTPQAPLAMAVDRTPRPWNEVLEVSATASIAEAQAAYRKKISQYHPDRVAGLGPELQALAEKHSKEINRAYDEARKLRGRG